MTLDATRAESDTQAIEYASTRDLALRNRLVAEHQWLVGLCARRMQRRREPLDDLMQVANIGLLQAIDRFDPNFGNSFRTFASATINGVLKKHYRGTWRLQVPRRVQEMHLAVAQATEHLTGTLGHQPSTAEVATHLHVSCLAVIDAIDAGTNFWPLSLSYGDDGTHVETSSGEEDIYHAVLKTDLERLLNKLTAVPRIVIYMRYMEDKTQTEISEELGITQVQVSRIMRAAILRLRGLYEREAA